VTDASQTVAQSYEHDAWGVRLASEGSLENPLQYQACAWLRSADLPHGFHSPGRYELASVGTFVQRDRLTATIVGGPYTYARTEPPGWVDGSGWAESLASRRIERFESHPEQARRWLGLFKERFGPFIDEAARKHCVPRALLATIVANEVIDWPGYEEFLETANLSLPSRPYRVWEAFPDPCRPSLGPAQLKVKVVLEHRAIDRELYEQFVRERFYLGSGALEAAYATAPSEMHRKDIEDTKRRVEARMQRYLDPYDPRVPRRDWFLAAYLRDPRYSIDSAGRLMRIYLEKLCSMAREGQIRASFKTPVAGSSSILARSPRAGGLRGFLGVSRSGS